MDGMKLHDHAVVIGKKTFEVCDGRKPDLMLVQHGSYIMMFVGSDVSKLLAVSRTISHVIKLDSLTLVADTYMSLGWKPDDQRVGKAPLEYWFQQGAEDVAEALHVTTVTPDDVIMTGVPYHFVGGDFTWLNDEGTHLQTTVKGAGGRVHDILVTTLMAEPDSDAPPVTNAAEMKVLMDMMLETFDLQGEVLWSPEMVES